MSFWTPLVSTFAVLAQTELGRLLATAATAGAAFIALKYVQRRAQQLTLTADVSRRRGKLVAARNLILVVALLITGGIWATKIAGAALSLAAVAGAILIVSKEALANLLGTAMLTISKPYRIGDFIELAHVSGRVVDTDLLTTTLAETQQAHQLTGRTVAIPNSVLLTQPVRNLTATGAYVIHLLPVSVPLDADLFACMDALLKAANKVCVRWIPEANQHFEHLEARELVDLPNARPKVLLADLSDSKVYTLAVRYACKPNDRVNVEQEILREYLRVFGGRTYSKTPVAEKVTEKAAVEA